MGKLLNIFRVYDLLYYASYRICMKSKNFAPKDAGYWLTETSEMTGIIAFTFLCLGLFSINLDWLKCNWRFYVFFVWIIIRLLSQVLYKYHLNRHEYVLEKYGHITSLWTCWIIYIIYGLAALALLIMAGMFYNNMK